MKYTACEAGETNTCTCIFDVYINGSGMNMNFKSLYCAACDVICSVYELGMPWLPIMQGCMHGGSVRTPYIYSLAHGKN